MNWWKKIVVYQIYPLSFLDTNNDGKGDLKGIINKIPYLNKLGIGAIWISPFFLSPMIDNGYDIENYEKINPDFGTLKDFKKLVKICNEHEIKIIVDFVANHTSDQHEWFKKAITGNSKYRDYYYFKDKPIKEITSVFGGDAWSKSPDGKYYLHTFSKNQVDLDWTNPNVRKEFIKIINFWIKLGIGGVRFDVIDNIAKNLDSKSLASGKNIDIKRLHKYIKEWKANSNWSKHNLLTVGESWDASIEKAILYSKPERNEMSMVFGFEHICSNWPTEGKWNATKLDLPKFKNIISKWQNGLYKNGWNSIFLNNHDLPRVISQFGDDSKYWIESAKCLALTMHMLQGTPFIYQGEEIGMTNVIFNSFEDHRDIEVIQMYKTLHDKNPNYTKQEHLKFVEKMNRDNARTPMQWNDKLNSGFSQTKPWLEINKNYQNINVEQALNDKDSIFYWYQKLISLRKDESDEMSQIIIHGKFKLLLFNHLQIFAYERIYEDKRFLVICNWSSDSVNIPKIIKFKSKDILLNNYDEITFNKLLPWQAILCK